MELMEHQKDAIRLMRNGCILHGGVGVGKTATALGYYIQNESNRDIYVITTARKRDSMDWEIEAGKFCIFTDENSRYGKLHVDSWNNIKKYTDIQNAFFILDEQRVSGNGEWVKAFYKIARKNHWILLSATPGDNWLDYAPVFIANGFFENITEFKRKHVIYEPFRRIPIVKGYINETKLELMRNHLLVEMPYIRTTERVINWIDVSYDKEQFKELWTRRWHPEENRPITDIAELFRVSRRLINSDPSRLEFIRKLLVPHDRLIVFYNFNYELNILRTLADEVNVLEWNGHRKDPLPDDGEWVYLVQYVAGAEAWNCTTADAMVFYSLTYSYKNFEQAKGRIDRLDTIYEKLYYYMLVSNSMIDDRIRKALINKKDFNEREMMRELEDSFAFGAEL